MSLKLFAPSAQPCLTEKSAIFTLFWVLACCFSISMSHSSLAGQLSEHAESSSVSVMAVNLYEAKMLLCRHFFTRALLSQETCSCKLDKEVRLSVQICYFPCHIYYWIFHELSFMLYEQSARNFRMRGRVRVRAQTTYAFHKINCLDQIFTFSKCKHNAHTQHKCVFFFSCFFLFESDVIES